jgi:hypothetical protein
MVLKNISFNKLQKKCQFHKQNDDNKVCSCYHQENRGGTCNKRNCPYIIRGEFNALAWKKENP